MDLRPAVVVRSSILRAIPEHGDFTAREVAEKALAFLQESNPEALAVWQEELTLRHLREMAADLMIEQRSNLRRKLKYERFEKTVEAVKAGENPLSQYFVVNESNTRRALADMTAYDLMYVAKSYDNQAARLTLEAAFFRALAKRVPEGMTVKDVLDTDEYVHLYKSITSPGESID